MPTHARPRLITTTAGAACWALPPISASRAAKPRVPKDGLKTTPISPNSLTAARVAKAILTKPERRATFTTRCCACGRQTTAQSPSDFRAKRTGRVTAAFLARLRGFATCCVAVLTSLGEAARARYGAKADGLAALRANRA